MYLSVQMNLFICINISGIITNGILLMVARGTCKINMRGCNYASNLHLIRYHCRGHQENVCLCTSTLKIDSIIQTIANTVNFVRAKD